MATSQHSDHEPKLAPAARHTTPPLAPAGDTPTVPAPNAAFPLQSLAVSTQIRTWGVSRWTRESFRASLQPLGLGGQVADPSREMRAAEYMVLRLLIGALWEEIILSKPDPMSALKSVSQRQLNALDALMEQRGSDFFNSIAMEEMETFWAGVRRTVERLSQDQP